MKKINTTKVKFKRSGIFKLFLLILIFISGCNPSGPVSDIPPNTVVPKEKQIDYQKMEVIGFIHFGVNTFTDREWGTGEEDPAIFNPEKLDAGQWVQTAKDAGMGMLIITAKHHDGFCLWPSEYTGHSVKNSPWKNGEGDVVKELSDACQKAGLKFGVYLSPWDMHEPRYGTDDYNTYYLNQLRELMSDYGAVSEVWMDGAKGKNARDMEYDFDAYRSLIYELQPRALIFSDVGPDVRWIGNENGIAGETNWSMISTDGLEIGKAKTDYLNSGDPRGNKWLVGECDVSVRPGWFYHASQDDQVKTPRQLVDLYYKSVGRNATLLLNIPPGPDGLIHENDVKALKEFRDILDETFAGNLCHRAGVNTSGQWSAGPGFSGSNITDEDPESYWIADSLDQEPVVTIDLGSMEVFDRIMLQEPIRIGQRIGEFVAEALVDDQWKTIARGTTIGYKRLLRFDPVQSGKIRIRISKFNNTPALSNVGIYKASARE